MRVYKGWRWLEMSKKGGLYVATGDSTSWQNYEPYKEIYASLIHKSIMENYGGCQLSLKGIGGSTSTEMLYILDYWLLSLPFDLITIGLGMNDSATDGTGVSNFTNNMNAIVDRIKLYKPNAEIILCAPNHTSDANRTPYIQNYRDTLEAVATAKSTLFCDFSQAFTTEQVATYTTDGIHPNGIGHTAIANLLYPIIQQTNFVASL